MQKNPWLSVGVTERSTFFELLKLLDGGVVPQMPDMYGESAKGFAQSCLRVDAASRPSASSLLSSDPWTRGTTAEEAESVVKDWVTGLSERTNNGVCPGVFEFFLRMGVFVHLNEFIRLRKHCPNPSPIRECVETTKYLL